VLRRTLLLLTMLAGLLLIAWSGWHNLRQSRSVLHLRPEDRVDLVPDTTSTASSSASSTTTQSSPLRGKPAPAFALADLDGHTVSLNDFKGRPLLINFWGTYCAPCKIEMPWLQEFSKKYSSSGFEIIGITYDAEVGKQTIARDTQQLGVTYPILLSDAKAEKDYLSGTDALPMSFYVDKAGKVIEVSAGLGSKDQLESLVKETIAAGNE